MFNYLCPNCNSTMQCISTTSIPPITRYVCFNCNYSSKPIREDYQAQVLPEELREEEE